MLWLLNEKIVMDWAFNYVVKEEMPFLVWKPIVKRALGRTKNRWKDNTLDLKEMSCEGGRWRYSCIIVFQVQ